MATGRTMWFGAGPARWPEKVLERAARELGPRAESGLSILELSHRGAEYAAVQENTVALLSRLLSVPESHEVLLLPGGATMQFAMLPANLRPAGSSADYVVTGNWSKKAALLARADGKVRVAATGEEDGFREIPPTQSWDLDEGAAYLHVTTNNTICGTQLHEIPEGLTAPLVADASSDVLTRELPLDRIAVLYGGAQKCIGPAGLGFVVIRKDLMERAPETLPSFWRYRDHSKASSRLNTPPTALIWLAGLMLEWIDREGGLREMMRRADERARLVYEALDAHPAVFEPVAAPEARSRTNVAFRLRDRDRERDLLELAARDGMAGLSGHRSVGGLRASMYTGMTVEAAGRFAGLLHDFAERSGRVGA
ncbi:MAG: 3-phosphoserine/phosphohydroxythreonine transaminase [Acidobacteriota bacterium]|nr:3-phosphoserine/phosphohydroxythreonine transaminase [Acidobacteriota bacterium]